MKKIYEEYTKTIQKAGKIEKACFTTFNFSFDFFETYILPPLLDIEIPTNEFEYENINNELENRNYESENSKIDIKIFYDFSALNLQDKKRTIIKVTPVLIEKGFFHPKVIYLEGDKGKFLIVGSNNLTLDGWGRNIESFFVVEVDKYLKTQVDYFFKNLVDSLEKVDFIEQLKNYDKFDFEKKYNFLFGNKIQNLLKNKEVIVFSPYFSDIKKLIEDLDISEYYIVPDVKNGKVRLKNIPNGVKFYSFKKFDYERFNHSKVFVTKSHLIIGSYNFTFQAMNENIEAAIVIKGDFFDEIKKSLEEIQVNSMNENELNSEEEMFEKRFKIGINLSFDYEAFEFKVKDLNEFDKSKINIILPPNIEKPLNKIYLNNEEKAKFLRAIIKNKIFRLKENEEIVFEGIINEINTKENRSVYKAETIEDIFISFLDDEPTKSSSSYERYVSKNLEETKETKSNFNEIINYYILFNGMKKLKEKLNKINKQDLIKFGFNNANSLNDLINVYKENKDKLSQTMQYIFAYELNNLIKEFNKKSDIKLDEIEYKKDKKIEKFLEKFKW